MKPTERRSGHEAQTIGLALELAVTTGQLVFGPLLAARRHLREGSLVWVDVHGWHVTETLHMACNGDRVLSRVRSGILSATGHALSRLEDLHPR